MRLSLAMRKKGLRIVGMKIMNVTEEIANAHYEEHIGKPFFKGLVEYITSGPVVALVLEGNGAVAAVRQMNGATNPANAELGTISWGLRAGGRPQCGSRLRQRRKRRKRNRHLLQARRIIGL